MATRRTVLIVNLILSLFFMMNVVSIWAGLDIYPGGTHYLLMGAIWGNLLWLLIPLIFRRHSSPFFLWARAVLGPFWVYWNMLIFLYTAFILILGLVWLVLLPFSWHTFQQFAHLPSNIFLGVLGFITLVGIFQALFTLNLRRVKVPIRGLHPDLAGFKIAMVSDLHVGLFSRGSRLRQFAQAAQDAQPDIFVVCGDITDDDPIFLPKFLESLEVLDPYLPAVGVLGNHDVYANPEKTLHVLEDSRLQMLVNEGMLMQKGEGKFWLAGIGDQGARRFGKWGSVAPDLDKALAERPEGAPVVLLAHQPQNFDDAKERGVALTLSGHTHGGQFGFWALNWSLAKPFMKYHMGLFIEGECYLYVTPGTGYWALPLRFGLSPEVSLIELVPG